MDNTRQEAAPGCISSSAISSLLNELLLGARWLWPPLTLQLVGLLGISQRVQEKSRRVLWMPVMRVAVFTEGENDSVNGHVIHLHVKVIPWAPHLYPEGLHMACVA